MFVCHSLIERWDRGPPFGLLYHVGLVPQGDVNNGGGQLARLPVHLHGDGLVGRQGDFPALVQPLAVASHLQRGLQGSKISMGLKQSARTQAH